MKRTTARLGPLALILGMAACSGARHEPTEKYYLVAVTTKLAYWQAEIGRAHV